MKTKRQSPKQQLLSDERIKTALAAVAEAQGPFIKRVEQLWSTAHPEFRRAALKKIIESERDVEVLNAATREYYALATDGAKQGAIRARVLLRDALSEFSAPFSALLNAADKVIDEIITERDAAEVEFYSDWGITGGEIETRVGSEARRVKRQIADERSRLFREVQGPAVHPTPSSLSSILAWFKA